ncbi:MAG: hypothetical protein WBQ08_07185 [Candidatus Sulfotelmatobacter sp.]
MREFPLKSGHGEAGYLLFVGGTTMGVDEAIKGGGILTGGELQKLEEAKQIPLPEATIYCSADWVSLKAIPAPSK